MLVIPAPCRTDLYEPKASKHSVEQEAIALLRILPSDTDMKLQTCGCHPKGVSGICQPQGTRDIVTRVASNLVARD